MSNAYTREMDAVRFSDDEKRAMAQALAAKALASQAEVIPMKNARKKSMAKMAAALGIVAVLGGAGAAKAATTFVSVDQFARVVFGGAACTELQGSVGRPLGVGESCNGVTITADAVIGDASNVAVVFSIARDDGRPFDLGGAEVRELPLTFGTDSMLVPGAMGMSGSSYFYDADPSDNAIQYVVQYNLSDLLGGSAAGRWAHVRFADLQLLGNEGAVVHSAVASMTGDGDEAEVETEVSGEASVEVAEGDTVSVGTSADTTMVAEGEWEFDLLLDYTDASVPLEAGATFELNGEPATLVSGRISPVALTLEYQAESAAELPDAPSGREPAELSMALDHYLQLSNVLLEFADGSELVVPDDGGGYIDESGDHTRAEKGVFLPEMVDVEQVVAVRINGTRIPLA